MYSFVKQRICLKFYMANETSCAYALKNLSTTRAYEWYKDSKIDLIVVDLPRSRRPSVDNDVFGKSVRNMVLEDIVPA